MKVGFIGQGWVGKNYADILEERGNEVVRYALEDQYRNNKGAIADCEIVFVAVPTPTTPNGSDDSIVREVASLVGRGNSLVIKSTVLPGVTESIQDAHSDIFVFHSPEFLSEATALYDASHPEVNIVGTAKDSPEHIERAKAILALLPQAPTETIMSSRESELLKYVHNTFLYTKVVYMNLMYDLASVLGCDWEKLRGVLSEQKFIGSFHLNPVHKGGRGIGGACHLKDFESLLQFHASLLPADASGQDIFSALTKKNLELLIGTNKDQAIVEGVFGAEYAKRYTSASDDQKGALPFTY